MNRAEPSRVECTVDIELIVKRTMETLVRRYASLWLRARVSRIDQMHEIPDNEAIVTLTPLGNSGLGGGGTSTGIGRTRSAVPMARTLDQKPIHVPTLA